MWSEPDADHVKYVYLFGYQAKATFIHITSLVTLEHPKTPKLNYT